MKVLLFLAVAFIFSDAAVAQVRRNDSNSLTRDTTKLRQRRVADNSNAVTRENPVYEKESYSRDLISAAIASDDTAAVFVITDGNSGVRSYEGSMPVRQVSALLEQIKTKPAKLILSAKQPRLENASLRFGSADINFETDKVTFVYRIDPKYITKETGNQTIDITSGQISSYTKTEIIKLDQRAYEYFNGFVAAKVNFQKNQKYLIQFHVESSKTIDYAVWVSKNYKEVVVTSSGTPSLPKPNQHYFLSGKKQINIIAEPGDYEGDYYVILAGNFQNGSWSFNRFEMTAIE